MAIGLLIIGDEILSGKRTDKHLQKLISLLKERGLQLAWTEIVGDERSRITASLRRSFASGDSVFCCGGIGATPDDHTRQCAAAALGVALALHPEAKLKIQERIAEVALSEGKDPDLQRPDNLHRLKMGEFPVGAGIVPNPFNKIPGFSIQNHYFLPGFPEMAGPMMAWVLNTYFADSFHQNARPERACLVYEMAESLLTPLMEQIEHDFPQVSVFSLPSVGNASTRRHIELGVKGDALMVPAAFERLIAGLDQFHAEYTLLATV
jgi:molybdopterin-biosynthesis enzyme MoeA-like protein